MISVPLFIFLYYILHGLYPTSDSGQPKLFPSVLPMSDPLTIPDSTYLIGPVSVDRDEYMRYCEKRNATTLAIATEDEFNKVSSAILTWAQQSKQFRYILYEMYQSIYIWTASIDIQEVWSYFNSFQPGLFVKNIFVKFGNLMSSSIHFIPPYPGRFGGSFAIRISRS